MSPVTPEEERQERFATPPEDPVSVDAGSLSDIGFRDLAVRFAFGAATSVVAAVVAAAAGAKWSGPLLAFPAILAASITLISDEESRKRAREDARGAVLGALALAVFALIGAVAFTHVPGGWVLALAAVAWLAAATGLYWVVWARRRPE